MYFTNITVAYVSRQTKTTVTYSFTAGLDHDNYYLK